MTDHPVLAIFGPTGSGKSAVAEVLAERIPAELISADAMQAYRGLPILTNQSPHPTRLVAIWPLEHEGSVAEYAELAHREIDTSLAAGRTPVVVGGTGLYFRAALAELALPPAPSAERREHYQRLYDEDPERSHALLADRDPGAAAAVHPNDRRRVVRALELTELGRSLVPERAQLWAGETRHPTILFGLELDREVLERRLGERVHAMFAAGVEEEVRKACEGPISATARYALGLDEINRLPRDEAIEALLVATRRYAAYQRKWMRRLPGLVSLPADRPPGDIADAILQVARARERLPARRAG